MQSLMKHEWVNVTVTTTNVLDPYCSVRRVASVTWLGLGSVFTSSHENFKFYRHFYFHISLYLTMRDDLLWVFRDRAKKESGTLLRTSLSRSVRRTCAPNLKEREKGTITLRTRKMENAMKLGLRATAASHKGY